MTQSNLSRRRFLKTGSALAAASFIAPQYLFGRPVQTPQGDIFQQFKCPQWLKDAKFGLWLHWGPQTVPEKGGGWYSRHLYSIEPAQKDGFGYETSSFHRQTYDMMYNPEKYPYVGHFEGLNLMVEYIEKYVSPSIVSTDFTGKKPFKFYEDPCR